MQKMLVIAVIGLIALIGSNTFTYFEGKRNGQNKAELQCKKAIEAKNRLVASQQQQIDERALFYENERTTFNRKINNLRKTVKLHGRPASCNITYGELGLFNAANGYAVQITPCPRESTCETNAATQISARRFIDTALDNAAECTSVRHQLEALIDAVSTSQSKNKK